MANIKVKDLTDTQTINTDNEIMVLTNEAQNQVQNITVGNLLSNILSSDNGNVLEQGADSKLYVETPENITGDLSNLTTTNKSTLVAAINEIDSDLTTEVTNRTNAVSAEATTRANADNNLQSQIDAITAASDVTDIVGTYAELQAYDTTGLPDNSIIKVLQDESRQNETTYYRWVITGSVGAWVLIGEEGPYTTIAYVDGNFTTKATVGNLSNLATSDKSSVVNAMNELASVLDPTQTADYIKNSKAIYSGEVSENALILPQIKEMAHSTFDLSKFTVVGSPTITDNGIASGFSGENYLELPDFDVTGKSFEFDLGKVYVPASTGASHALFNVLVDPKEVSNVLNFAVGSAGEMYVSGANKNAAVKYLTGYSLNNYYWVKIGSDNSTIVYCKISTDGVNYTTITTPLLSPYTTISHHGIGRGNSDTSYWLGDYDLRQFKLSVDGVEVFSGNRTGIDTIKPDNYTVVGTPTISNIGYMNCSGGWIKTNESFDVAGKAFDEQISFAVTNDFLIHSGDNHFMGDYVRGVRNFCAYVTPENNYHMNAILSDDSILRIYVTYSDIQLDDIITVNSGREKTSTGYIYYIKVYKNGVLQGTATQDSTLDLKVTTFPQVYFGSIFSDISNTQYCRGLIDLNKCKVTISGNLVYQPCLKIPYTYAGNGKGYNASTGSKIVQSVYRDRVNDMYEQFGYAPYYTLSDNNFTLPQGELYGYLEKRARDIAHPVAQPFYIFSDEKNEDEVRLEGAEVDKGLYLAIENDPYLSGLCKPGSTSDKIKLPDFRGKVIYGDVASGYVSPELPNITGDISVQWAFNYSAVGNAGNGALYNNYSAQSQNGIVYNANTTNSADSNIRFNASRSSSIYKNDGTVKTAGVKARWLCRWK